MDINNILNKIDNAVSALERVSCSGTQNHLNLGGACSYLYEVKQELINEFQKSVKAVEE